MEKWPHTPNELLNLTVQKCIELGRVPSYRAWMNDPSFEFDEIVEVLGRGDWERAEKKITLAWGHRIAREAYLKRKGDEKMEGKSTKKWPHTYDELLESAIEFCARHGGVPSERIWSDTAVLNFDEIVEVIGGGNWERAYSKIRRAWGEYKQNREGAERPAEPEQKGDDNKPVRYRYTPAEQVQTVEPRTRNAPRRIYTMEDLREEMVRIQEYVGATDIPTQPQINRAAREIGTPSYPTFSLRLGAKRLWARTLGLEDPVKPTEEALPKEEANEASGLQEAAEAEATEVFEPQPIEPEMAEASESQKEAEIAELSEPQEASEVEVLIGELVICGIRLDAILNGQRMQLEVKFGKE